MSYIRCRLCNSPSKMFCLDLGLWINKCFIASPFCPACWCSSQCLFPGDLMKAWVLLCTISELPSKKKLHRPEVSHIGWLCFLAGDLSQTWVQAGLSHPWPGCLCNDSPVGSCPPSLTPNRMLLSTKSEPRGGPLEPTHGSLCLGLLVSAVSQLTPRPVKVGTLATAIYNSPNAHLESGWGHFSVIKVPCSCVLVSPRLTQAQPHNLFSHNFFELVFSPNSQNNLSCLMMFYLTCVEPSPSVNYNWLL